MFKLRQARNEILLFATKRPVGGVKCRIPEIRSNEPVVFRQIKLWPGGENRLFR